MTDTSPDTIARMLDGVTDGPWQHGVLDADGPWAVGPDHALLKACAAPGPHNEANTRFTAWSREAVPALAAERDALAAENQRLRDALNEKFSFDKADWYWRTMDPDDCGDNPEEAINRAMVGCFCVCEIASSFSGPTRYGFIAPVMDPESDDTEFVHFTTQQEAIDAARARAALDRIHKITGGE